MFLASVIFQRFKKPIKKLAKLVNTKFFLSKSLKKLEKLVNTSFFNEKYIKAKKSW